MEGREYDSQPLMELMLTNAMLDCEMQSFKSKIQSRNDENTKLENMITEYRQKISQLEKTIHTSLEREEKVKANIDTLRNSRFITEGLVMSMKYELHAKQEKRAETKRTREKIIQKYTGIFNSYKEVYKNLPWILENQELKISVEAGKIHLLVLKSEYASYKKKLSLFHNISEQRKLVAIVNLAKMLVQRNKLHTEVKEITNQIQEREELIKKLEEQKIKTLEQIDLKVKAAIAEARERATKLPTTSYIENIRHTAVSVVSSFNKSNIESIFSRLGIGGPLSLKRPLITKPSVPEKVSRAADQSHPLENYLRNEQKDLDSYRKRFDIASSKQSTQESSMLSCLMKKERNDKYNKNNKSENENVISTVSRNENATPNVSKKEIKIKRSSKGKDDKSSPTGEHNTIIPENPQSTSKATENQPTNKPLSPSIESTDESDNNTGRPEKRKKKLKKKSKKMAIEKPLAKNIVERNNETTFLADNNNQAKEKEYEQMEANVMHEEMFEPMPSTSKEINQPVPEVMEQAIPEEQCEPYQMSDDVHLPEEQCEPYQMTDDAPLHVQQSDICTTDSDAGSDCFNEYEEKYNALAAANISIDSDSVLSANFNMEHREEHLEQNIASPEFFVQRPQGYCFSPPFGQTSSPKAEKSDKGKKNDFGDSGAMSPFFMMDSTKTTKEGTSTSFTDFFGSMSPKKSDQSTKSFFSLF